MAIVTGDRYLERLVRFVGRNAEALLEGSLTLKLNPVGLHYVHSRLESLRELEALLAGAPVDYLRAYVSDLGDHRALEQLRRILLLLTSLKVVSVLPHPTRDPTPISLLPFARLRFLELRGCDLSTSTARGLLELRHTLEKLICHNSTDALRHVFASRIVDIKESPAWNRLLFVSCACNGLVFMDESLQLLPAVETLDLSRNGFAKVDNLRKCTKLKVLDLGFNHLRTVALLTEASYTIVKLVLRNNAVATLRGLESLKSLEGLDLSCNLISSFPELEIIASLPCLQSLWLEGNPICCSRWYRAHVFSFFFHPEKLKLDDKGISTREYWERHIIFTNRQQQPAGYGFYFPAKDGAEDEGSVNSKRKKYSRLVSIEDDGSRGYICSESVDQESVSCDSDNLRKDESALSDCGSEVDDLMNRVECMKKEHSVLWLREFKKWLDQTSEDKIDGSQCMCSNLTSVEEEYVKQRKDGKHLGETSNYDPEMEHVSEDGNGSSISVSDMSFTGPSAGAYGYEYSDPTDRDVTEPAVLNGGHISTTYSRFEGVDSERRHLNINLREPQYVSHLEGNGQSRVEHVDPDISRAPLTALDEIFGSRASSVYPGSPPHYQQDILHRRLYLEEEFLQLSTESLSVASSDSDTSCSDGDNSCRYCASLNKSGCVLFQDLTEQGTSVNLNALCYKDRDHSGRGNTCLVESTRDTYDCCTGPEYLLPNQGKPVHNISNGSSCDVVNPAFGQDGSEAKVENDKHKAKRRIISIVENAVVHNTETASQYSNGFMGTGKADINTQMKAISDNNIVSGSCEQAAISHNQEASNLHTSDAHSSHLNTNINYPNHVQDHVINDYFNTKVADSKASETLQELVQCGCIFQFGSIFQESEVALLRSSKNNLYILHTDAESGGQGIFFKVLGCHRLEDVREIVTGLGLQALRVNLKGNATYLFLTRTVEKSNGLLHLLCVCDSPALSTGCSILSWEQVQVKLLEKYIFGQLKLNIFLYSMLLFWHDKCEGESWLPRSLLVIEGNMFMCIENLVQFGSFTDDSESSCPYYSLDSCCPIQNILKVVIEFDENRCLTLTLDYVESGTTYYTDMIENKKQSTNKDQVLTWKLKWFSKDTLLKFVALLKAIYSGLMLSPLPVKCVS